jgi:DNA-binding GntR family transcriptional regulator
VIRKTTGDAMVTGGEVSLHDEVVAFVRRYIIEGNLSEGERIPEKQLCEQLGVSRTPLREALKVLAAEGLVDLPPNRGARIRALSAEDVQSLFEVLAGLEAHAGRLACQRITEAQVAEIESLHLQMYSAFISRNLAQYFELNQAIHGRLLAAAGNKALEVAHQNYASRVQRLRYQANRIKEWDRWSQAMREHELILAALVERDGLRLAEILVEHLMNKCAAVLDVGETATSGPGQQQSVGN